MKITRYRSKRTIEAVQWDGANEDQIAEFLGHLHYGMKVKEESLHAQRVLAIDVGWGTIYVKEGDFVSRDENDHVSHNSSAWFLTYFEEQA